jgi:hypothetical protein
MFSAYHIPIAMEGDSMGLLAVNQYNFSPQYTYCVMLPQKKKGNPRVNFFRWKSEPKFVFQEP